MNRAELMQAIDVEFERYADGQGSISLEYLRSQIRSLINFFCEGIIDAIDGEEEE